MAVTKRIEDRIYEFALRTIRLARALPEDYASRAIGRQVLRSGTGIGANVEEAIAASSRKISQIKWRLLANKRARPIIGFGLFVIQI